MEKQAKVFNNATSNGAKKPDTPVNKTVPNAVDLLSASQVQNGVYDISGRQGNQEIMAQNKAMLDKGTRNAAGLGAVDSAGKFAPESNYAITRNRALESTGNEVYDDIYNKGMTDINRDYADLRVNPRVNKDAYRKKWLWGLIRKTNHKKYNADKARWAERTRRIRELRSQAANARDTLRSTGQFTGPADKNILNFDYTDQVPLGLRTVTRLNPDGSTTTLQVPSTTAGGLANYEGVTELGNKQREAFIRSLNAALAKGKGYQINEGSRLYSQLNQALRNAGTVNLKDELRGNAGEEMFMRSAPWQEIAKRLEEAGVDKAQAERAVRLYLRNQVNGMGAGRE